VIEVNVRLSPLRDWPTESNVFAGQSEDLVRSLGNRQVIPREYIDASWTAANWLAPVEIHFRDVHHPPVPTRLESRGVVSIWIVIHTIRVTSM
jgi:hypothetical protein